MLRHVFAARLFSATVALACFQAQFLRAQNDSFEALFQKATQELRSSQLDAAAADFTRCISANPNFAQSYFNLGLIRFQQRRFDDVENLLTQALKLDPSLRGAHLFLGISAYRLDRYKEAVAALTAAAKAEPANPEAVMWLGIAELADNNAASSVRHLESASKLQPNNPDILYHLGRAYMQQSKETYERMYQTDPKSWRVHQVLAQSFEEADRLDDAVTECQTALRLKPSEPGLHQMLAEIYWKQNNLEKAEGEFQAELTNDPQNFTAMYKLASVSIERSKPEAAIALLNEVLSKHPESREAHYQLGRADAQLGQTGPAIQEFVTVTNGTGPVAPETLRQSYYQLAQLYRRTQRLEDSRVALAAFTRLKQQSDLDQEQKLQDKMKRSTEAQP